MIKYLLCFVLINEYFVITGKTDYIKENVVSDVLTQSLVNYGVLTYRSL